MTWRWLALLLLICYSFAMGKVAVSSPQVHLRLSSALQERIAKAASAIDQPIAAWLRLAIVEKLERDER